MPRHVGVCMNVDEVIKLVSLALFAGAALVGLPVGLLLGALVRSPPSPPLPSRRASEVLLLAERDASTLRAKRGAL